VLTSDTNVTLPDGEVVASGTRLRDKFHLTKYAKADLFVPCGGRPGAVNQSNVDQLFESGKCKFTYIVEGANLFITAGARAVLEKAGVHLIRDASANKGGVTASSLEVFASLALSGADHEKYMTVPPGGEKPEFYEQYIADVVATVRANARAEFETIWRENQASGTSKVALTQAVSAKINAIQDAAMRDLDVDSPLFQHVLTKACPPLLLERAGVAAIRANVPPAYLKAVVASYLASRYVYAEGVGAGEFAFFKFMNSLNPSTA